MFGKLIINVAFVCAEVAILVRFYPLRCENSAQQMPAPVLALPLSIISFS